MSGAMTPKGTMLKDTTPVATTEAGMISLGSMPMAKTGVARTEAATKSHDHKQSVSLLSKDVVGPSQLGYSTLMNIDYILLSCCC